MTHTALTPALISGTQVAQSPLQQTKLVKAAKEFEALFLKELLKPMQGDEDEQSGADANIAGMATEGLAQGLAAQGGVGLANSVLKQLHAR